MLEAVFNDKVKFLSIEEITPGMISFQDIYSDTGQLLVAKDTELTPNHIDKLLSYDIPGVPIIKEDDEEELTTENIQDTEEFKEFKENYEDTKSSVQSQILDIGDGKSIDVTELFTITNDLMGDMNYKSSLFNFLNNIQHFDDYTYSHSLNVSLIAYTLGQWLNLSGDELENLTVAGLLHDVGKTKIPLDILNKPDKLTDDEFEEVKKHTIYGYEIVEHQDIPYEMKMAVLMHHERYDGSGYPFKVKNEKINKYAKIIAIADLYDAMTSDRPYRKKITPFQVINEFQRNYLGKLDTAILMVFLQNIAYCYLDAMCELSNGETGKIIFINKQRPSQPIVKVGDGIVDLSQQKELSIVKLL